MPINYDEVYTFTSMPHPKNGDYSSISSPECFRFPNQLRLDWFNRLDEVEAMDLRFELINDDYHPDVLSLGYFVCLRTNVIEALEAEGITGFYPKNVEVYDSEGKTYIDYYFLMITGRCGKKDWNRPVRIEKRNSQYAEWDVKVGMKFMDDEYDGSDIFLCPDYGALFVTERVKKLIESNSFSGAQFESINSLEHTVNESTVFYSAEAQKRWDQI
jgi:hypothetical protein